MNEHLQGIGANLTDESAGEIPSVQMEPAVVRAPPKVQKYAPDCWQEDRIVIILEASDKIPPTGQFFGLDGVGYMLKAGMEAAVPKGIVDILNHAITSVPIVDTNDANRVVGYQDQLRFPYRVIRYIKAGTPIEKKE
jgi:hypothetical protein